MVDRTGTGRGTHFLKSALCDPHPTETQVPAVNAPEVFLYDLSLVYD